MELGTALGEKIMLLTLSKQKHPPLGKRRGSGQMKDVSVSMGVGGGTGPPGPRYSLHASLPPPPPSNVYILETEHVFSGQC